MSHFKSSVSAFALVIALGSTGTAFAMENEDGNSQEVAAALAAKISLTQAITSAEQQTGERAFRIGLEEHDGTYAYKIKVISTDDNVFEVSVDPASGKVLRTEAEGLISRVFDGEDRTVAAKLKDAQTTLGGAIAAAEQQAGGKAIEAGYESENGRMQFQVSIAKDHTVSDVKIDGATAKIIRIEAAGDGEQQDGGQHEDCTGNKCPEPACSKWRRPTSDRSSNVTE